MPAMLAICVYLRFSSFTCSLTQAPHYGYAMRTRRKWLLMLAAGAALIITLAFVLPLSKREPEPTHNGRTLSEWLKDYRRPERNWGMPTEAELAVRSIGTNALPFLLEWIRYELPPWRSKLLQLATRPVEGKTLDEAQIVYGQSFILGKSTRLAELAEVGFIVLTTNAASAIPELEALMKDHQNPVVRVRAIYALGEIGGPAIPALANALADINQSNRIEIIYAIFAVERNSPPYCRDTCRAACLPALTRALNDPDAEVRRQAKVTLYNIVPRKLTSALPPQ
jgi:hypothetical protein